MKLLLLGEVSAFGPSLLQIFRSLNCEHIALGGDDSVPDLGVPRNILAPARPRRQAVEALRRWFFRRKADSAFLLTGFPSSLDEAGMLDAWLDERGETLDVCLFPHASPAGAAADLFRHYQVHGSAWKSSDTAPLPEWLALSHAP